MSHMSSSLRTMRPEPKRCGSVLAAAADGFTGFIHNQGGSAEQVLVSAGMPEDLLGAPTAELDLQSYIQMMESAARETRNPNFGLDFGQTFTPDRLGLIGEIAISAPTLGAALDNFIGMFPLHQENTQTRIIKDGASIRLEYRVLDGAIINRRQDSELTMGMFANVMRHCLGPRWSPAEVHFEHPQPPASKAHEQAFDAPIFFGQPTNALVLRNIPLERPMPQANISQFDKMRHDLVHLHRGTGELALFSRVRAEIRSLLPTLHPTIDMVADQLKIPRWTLQRRLADEGFSFSVLVERVRRELAELYLTQIHIPINDIAFLLGYSELSAFSRAFSKWSGSSPRAYRLNAANCASMSH